MFKLYSLAFRQRDHPEGSCLPRLHLLSWQSSIASSVVFLYIRLLIIFQLSLLEFEMLDHLLDLIYSTSVISAHSQVRDPLLIFEFPFYFFQDERHRKRHQLRTLWRQCDRNNVSRVW